MTDAAPVDPFLIDLPRGAGRLILRPADAWPRDIGVVHLTVEGLSPFVEGRWRIEAERARRSVADKISMNVAELEALLFPAFSMWRDLALAQLRALQGTTATAPPPPSGSGAVAVTLRGVHQPAGEGKRIDVDGEEAWQRLLSAPASPDSILAWGKEDLGRAAILDLDFHGESKPTAQELEAWMVRLQPAPFLWWMTQGHGAHALYLPAEAERRTSMTYTAEELASAAAIQVYLSSGMRTYGGSVEVLHQTRNPAATQKGRPCGPLRPGSGSRASIGLWATLCESQADESAVDTFVEDRSWVIGERYEHGQCPFHSDHPSQSPDPVLIQPWGVQCYSCQGNGRGGRWPWGTVLRAFGVRSSFTPMPIRDAVINFAHFEHMRYVLDSAFDEDEKLERYLPAVYRTLLRHAHGDDPRIDRCFCRFLFVRGKNGWLHAEDLRETGRPLTRDDVSAMSSAVSVVMGDDGPTFKPIPENVASHKHDGLVPGYLPLAPLGSVPLYFHHNRSTDNPDDGLLVRSRKARSLRNRRLSYVAPEQRMHPDDYERVILDYFPGLNLTYLRAVLIAIGSAESGNANEVPVLYATGDSGSAKTAVVFIATAMLSMGGGDIHMMVKQKQNESLEEHLGYAIGGNCRLVLADDFAKSEELVQEYHGLVLRLNYQAFSYRKLHVGPVRVQPRLPLILTDRRVPKYLSQDVQFSRRVFLIDNRSRVSWRELGRTIDGWCWKTDEMTKAAASLYSDLIDDYFPFGDREPFAAKMARLGVLRMEDDSAASMGEDRDIRRALVRVVVEELVNSGVEDPLIRDKVGRGYRRVDTGGKMQTNHRLSDACLHLVHQKGDVPLNDRTLSEVLDDFNSTLATMYVFLPGIYGRFQVKQIGRAVYVRLYQEGALTRSKSALVNGELFAHPLTALADPTGCGDQSEPTPAPRVVAPLAACSLPGGAPIGRDATRKLTNHVNGD